MKKKGKVIIAGVIIAVLGVVVVICALGMSGWNANNLSDWEENSYSATTEIYKLNVEANAGRVIIKHGATEEVYIKYQYNDRYQPVITESAGVLTVKSAKTKWYAINLWFDTAPTIEIHVPQDSKPSIELELNAGTVEFGEGNWGKSIRIDVNAGTLNMGDVVVERLYVKLNAGAFSAGDLKCDDVSVYLNAGAFDVKEVVCDVFDCNVRAGAAEVKRLDSQIVKVTVSAGSVDLGLKGSQTDYSVRVSKSAGSCNVSERPDTRAPRTLAIDISAGSVDVAFGK